jgi:hypothetical protein
MVRLQRLLDKSMLHVDARDALVLLFMWQTPRLFVMFAQSAARL